jgi:hypothetical protein
MAVGDCHEISSAATPTIGTRPTLKSLAQRVDLLSKRIDKEPVVGQAVTRDSCSANQRLAWHAEPGAYSTMSFTADPCISVFVYLLSFLLKHDSVDSETAFEVLQGLCKLAQCQDKRDDKREMTTSLLQCVVKMQKEEHVSVVYTGDKAIAGSRVTVFKLH